MLFFTYNFAPCDRTCSPPPHTAKENKDKGEGPSLEGAFSGHCERLVDSSSSSVQHPAIVCRCRGGADCFLVHGDSASGEVYWLRYSPSVSTKCLKFMENHSLVSVIE